METKSSIEFKLNQLDTINLSAPVLISNANVDITGVPKFADKATAEAALAVGEVYINTTTGALAVALA